jgi:hypothetical protein
MQYTAVTTVVVTLGSSLISLMVENKTVLCAHEQGLPAQCLVGWASHSWVGPMLAFGLFIGLICITGFNYAVFKMLMTSCISQNSLPPSSPFIVITTTIIVFQVEHIPPLVFSSLGLLDPLATGLVSWLAGIEGIPDLTTWLSGVVVMGGVALISYGEQLRHSDRDEEATDGEEDPAGVEMGNAKLRLRAAVVAAEEEADDQIAAQDDAVSHVARQFFWLRSPSLFFFQAADKSRQDATPTTSSSSSNILESRGPVSRREAGQTLIYAPLHSDDIDDDDESGAEEHRRFSQEETASQLERKDVGCAAEQISADEKTHLASPGQTT